jgi:hypothetical protein
MHWNTGPLLREFWNGAVVGLTEALGPENVFVSVYESGSWDDSKTALEELEVELARRDVPRNIHMSNVTHKDEISRRPGGSGWIETPRGKRELRRIPFLAQLRNRTLRDLTELAAQGEVFDKILFLNDVVFSVRYPRWPMGSPLTCVPDPRRPDAAGHQWRTVRGRLLPRLLQPAAVLRYVRPAGH